MRKEKMLETLKSLECSLHRDKRNNREWLEALLHPDFTEITRSGFQVTRDTTITALVDETPLVPLRSTDWQIMSISADQALLIYRTALPDGTRASLRSSHWLLSAEGRWQMVFHQGTPAGI